MNYLDFVAIGEPMEALKMTLVRFSASRAHGQND
jgi:hypothetical protein